MTYFYDPNFQDPRACLMLNNPVWVRSSRKSLRQVFMTRLIGWPTTSLLTEIEFLMPNFLLTFPWNLKKIGQRQKVIVQRSEELNHKVFPLSNQIKWIQRCRWYIYSKQYRTLQVCPWSVWLNSLSLYMDENFFMSFDHRHKVENSKTYQVKWHQHWTY